METTNTTPTPILTLKDAKWLFKIINTSMDLLGTTTEFMEGLEERKETFIKAFGEENSMTNGQALDLPDNTELGNEALEKYQEIESFHKDNLGKPC